LEITDRGRLLLAGGVQTRGLKKKVICLGDLKWVVNRDEKKKGGKRKRLKIGEEKTTSSERKKSTIRGPI